MTELRFPWEFEPRDYQLPLLRAVDRGVKRGISVWHRRSGKDKTFINIVGKKSVERKGTYYYYFPTQSLARKILWNGMDKDGFRFMDHFPADGIRRKNARDMLIEFKQYEPVTVDEVRMTITGWPAGITPALIDFTVFGKRLF